MKFYLLPTAIFAASVSAQSLADLCTTAHVVASLPTVNITGLTIDTSSVTASPVYNASVSGETNFRNASGLSYCNVTFSYAHDGVDYPVTVQYFLPAPSAYQNRFLATGGGGNAINSGSTGLLQGIINGAVAGLTDGGFGSFTNEVTSVLLAANGTMNYNALYSFGYKGIHEMTVMGKQLSSNFYNSSSLYSYYFGCSEGGREGFSQVQRYGDQFNGAVIGAPAIRQAFQQVNHLFAGVAEKTLNYAPSPCELQKILNDTIAACDPLDGKTDGVVSRTDLCKLQYNVSASIGQPYSCPASGVSSSSGNSSSNGTSVGGMRRRQMGGPMGGGGSSISTPAQNGTVTAEAALLVETLNKGLFDSTGKQVYIYYQPSSTFDDAQTTYNSSSEEWYASASGIGVTWIQMYLEMISTTATLSLSNITYDTLRDWMTQGLQQYQSTMETTYPDLTPFQSAGGKIISYHGESDYSVPTDSSVLYQDAVRTTMYPGLDYNSSFSQLNDWYRLFLVPGAGHCAPSDTQPNGPFPMTTLETLIMWVEDGVNPETLNGTISAQSSQYYGQTQPICSWPLRPQFAGNDTAVADVQCVYPDQDALDTWYPTLDSVLVPIY